jgi:hypothetical protein
VTNVPASVKVRIDGFLAKALSAQTEYAKVALSEREAACNAARADNPDTASQNDRLHVYEGSDWTSGWARGRWLSVRLHTTESSNRQAHPSDSYAAYTFDLEHGGYPVPTSGYYTRAQRKRLNAAVYAADVAAFSAFAKQNPGDGPVDLSYLRAKDTALQLDATQILLTDSGIELTHTDESEAARGLILKIPFAKLAGIGTPGGPLDPATR